MTPLAAGAKLQKPGEEAGYNFHGMKHPTSISFVRHGEVHNPQDLFYGRLDGFPLSDLGRQQALAVGISLKDTPLAALYSSPMLRARQTAEMILDSREGTELIVDELINEVKSPYDGIPSSEVEALNWDIYANVGTGYEQPEDVLARALRFIRKTLRKHPGKHIVAVTHRDLIVFMFLWYKDRPIGAAEKQSLNRKFISPGSISTFTYYSSDLKGGKPEFSYVSPTL